MGYISFLRWLIIVVVVSIGAFFAAQFGLFSTIYVHDDSKICFLIFGILVAMTIWCGILTYHAGCKPRDGLVNKIESKADIGWFMSDICLSLGMLGTVIGFIMILVGGFEVVVAGDPSSIQKLFTKLSAGLGTALYTTLAGLISSMIIKIQYFNLCNTLDSEK